MDNTYKSNYIIFIVFLKLICTLLIYAKLTICIVFNSGLQHWMCFLEAFVSPENDKLCMDDNSV